MTTQGKSLEELGRRAVACKHWRWMPGMLHGIEAMDETRFVSRFSEFSIYADDDGRIPILSDPATLGCLLALVEDAYGTCDLGGRGHPSDLGFTHRVFPYDHDACFEGRTRAEALVVALEAAP